MTQTIRSEEARNRFRDMLDTAVAGKETVIERHGKPAAVVVNYSAWQKWKEERKRLKHLEALLEVREVRARIARGEEKLTSGDELLRIITEKRTNAAASAPVGH